MSQAPASPAPIPYRRTVFFGVAMGAHLLGYDNTMVAIALPRMQGPMSATQDEITWVLTAYLIAVAVVMPVLGPLINRFGRKHVYLISAAGFAVTAILAGSSETLFELVFYRFLQGVFSSTFQPISQGFVFEAYSHEERGGAMGWWTVGLMSGMVSGPLVGGYITEFYSWRLAFYLNVPITLVSIAVISIFSLSRPSTTPVRRINVGGYLVLVVGLVALQFVLSRGERMDWLAAPEIVVALGVSMIALYLFVVHTLTSAHPFIELEVFQDRNFMISCVLFFVMGAYWLAFISLASPFLQTLAGYPVMTAGVVLATQAAANAMAALLCGRLVRYVPPPVIIGLGLALMAYASWLFSLFTPEFSQLEAIAVLGISGLGNGIFFVSLAVVAFSTLPTRQTNVGAGFFALTRNLGSSFGASVVVAYLVRQTQANHARISENISPFSESIRHVPLPDAWNLGDVSSLAALNLEATRQATMLAYIDDFRWLTFFVAASIPLLLLVRMPRRATQAAAAAAE